MTKEVVNLRGNITRALQQAGVEFPPSATTQQLRKLLLNVAGDNRYTTFADIAATSSNAIETAVTIAANIAPGNAGTDVYDNGNTHAAVASLPSAAIFTDANSATAAPTSDAETSITTAERMPRSLENIDQEVMALRKRLEMLQLMQQIDQLESRNIVRDQRRLDFGEIEHAITKLSGDDVSHTVGHFLRDFEEIMGSSGADDRFRLLTLRRSLTGTAKVFLSTTAALNYDDLKNELKVEFNTPITRQEIYKMLAQRRWRNKDETLHCYVLTMQAIAKRANISEIEVIDFIIE